MKRSLFIAFFFLSACIKDPSCEIDHVPSNDKKYSSSRLRFSDSAYKEIELEILFLAKSAKCFLNFYRNNISNEQDRLVKISTEDKNLEEICYCMRGKQRLLLSDKLTNLIIDCLKDGKKISIIHNKNTINIDGQEFAVAYKKTQIFDFIFFFKKFNQSIK